MLFHFVKSLEEVKENIGKKYEALLPVLEVLLGVEETTVRDRAAKIVSALGQEMTKEQVTGKIYPIMKHLSESEWFTPRRSACHLLVCVYTKGEPSSRNSVLETFNLFVADETPMVRRAAAVALGGKTKTKNKKKKITPPSSSRRNGGRSRRSCNSCRAAGAHLAKLNR